MPFITKTVTLSCTLLAHLHHVWYYTSVTKWALNLVSW